MSGWSLTSAADTTNTANWGNDNIWELGYDPERWGMVPDPLTLSTVIRGGNYDYVANQVAWTASFSSQTLPNSLYLNAKPSFFGNYQWPWVTPTGSTQLYTLPAKARLDAGTPFALAPGASGL
jgi:hypothetical protein